MKKAFIIPIVALTIVGGTLIAVMPAQAQTGVPPRTVLIRRLSEKFGVPSTEVEAVMEEARAEHRQERQKELEERLNTAVSNGNLTQQQKAAILAKHQELLATWEAGREQFQAMSPEEKRAAREQARVELEEWAKAQGIDVKFFMVMHKGMGKMHQYDGE